MDLATVARSERAAGRFSDLYQRVPALIGTSQNAAASSQGTFSEPEFRNDSEYPVEVYGLGFSLANALSSPANVSYCGVALALKDVLRNFEVTNFSSGVRIGGLLDLVGNLHTGQDLQAFNGNRWQLRYPWLLPATARVAVKQFTAANNDSSNLAVVLLGSYLVPTHVPRYREAAEQLARALPLGPLRPLLPSSDGVLGYERVPFVKEGLIDASTSVPPVLIGDDSTYRNDSGHDWHVYEIGIWLDGAVANLPIRALNDLSLRVVDPVRNIEWNKLAQPASALVKYTSSRMSIGPGTVFNGVKWDLGPGTVLPPGTNLRIYSTNNVAPTALTARVVVIGDCLVPVVKGTPAAEAFERCLRAVPAWW